MPGIRMRAIKVSKDFLDSKKGKRAVDNALDGGSLAVKVDFNVVTQTWKHQPGFVIEKREGAREIYTIDKIFTIVTRGARPHIIQAKPGKTLRFMSKFRPKSRPNAIRSNAGFVGGKVVYARRVNHPGHKARDFDIAIAKKWAKEFPAIMQRAIDSEAAF